MGMSRSIRRRKKNVLVVTFAVLCLCLIGVISVVSVLANTGIFDRDTICEGVHIDSVDVSGMTEEQAAAAVDAYVRELGRRTLTVTVRGREETVAFEELGFACEDNNFVEDALNVGTKGNFLKRYKEMKDVEEDQLVYEQTYTFDEEIIRTFVEERLSVYDRKVKNSKLKYSGGTFTATKSRMGKKVDVEETVQKILSNLQECGEEDNVTIDAVVIEEEPRYTKETVSLCKDKLSSYSTTYASSTEARAGNVANAANYINGTILYPGETFSTVEVIKDRTVENGYQVAAEYSSGKVVDGVGGGVCQVSTTLYNAVLRAELEIVERAPHSMVVSYVDVSMDAAIAGDYKDFKFKNNTDAPVYIAASAVDRVLTFTIYGHETRDSARTISFESVIKETIDPGEDVVTYDDSLPSTYSHVDQSAHVGYKAELWKVISENGTEVERVQINSSSYAPSPTYITKGKQEAEATPSPKPKETKSPSGKGGTSGKKPTGNGKTDTGKPTATPTPTATPAPEPETGDEGAAE